VPAPAEAPVAFARLLRRRGLDVPGTAVLSFTEALAVLDVRRPDATYWAGRATLVRRSEDIPAYDRAFADFWTGRAEPDEQPQVAIPITLLTDDASDDNDDEDTPSTGPDELTRELRFSKVERLSGKDFAACSDDERAELYDALARLRVGGLTRRSRRLAAASGPSGRLDLRRTVRDAKRTGGETLRLHTRQPRQRPRRLVLLLDVSGSMDPYARALVRFAHAAVLARRHVEVFTLGTRLTRVTRQLSGPDPDLAVAAATAEVVDWSGGTRLGEVIGAFNDRWGVAGLARGAVVVILSDGWDRGEPDRLAEEMARLRRVAHTVIWVNPLKAAPGDEPLARGMAAALPHVDRFVPGHSLAALVDLADLVAGAVPATAGHTGTP
jgi:uncharacterized protein with von Willebrand factor type A (vWA) domain